MKVTKLADISSLYVEPSKSLPQDKCIMANVPEIQSLVAKEIKP